MAFFNLIFFYDRDCSEHGARGDEPRSLEGHSRPICVFIELKYNKQGAMNNINDGKLLQNMYSVKLVPIAPKHVSLDGHG